MSVARHYFDALFLQERRRFDFLLSTKTLQRRLLRTRSHGRLASKTEPTLSKSSTAVNNIRQRARQSTVKDLNTSPQSLESLHSVPITKVLSESPPTYVRPTIVCLSQPEGRTRSLEQGRLDKSPSLPNRQIAAESRSSYDLLDFEDDGHGSNAFDDQRSARGIQEPLKPWKSIAENLSSRPEPGTVGDDARMDRQYTNSIQSLGDAAWRELPAISQESNLWHRDDLDKHLRRPPTPDWQKNYMASRIQSFLASLRKMANFCRKSKDTQGRLPGRFKAGMLNYLLRRAARQPRARILEFDANSVEGGAIEALDATNDELSGDRTDRQMEIQAACKALKKFWEMEVIDTNPTDSDENVLRNICQCVKQIISSDSPKLNIQELRGMERLADAFSLLIHHYNALQQLIASTTSSAISTKQSETQTLSPIQNDDSTETHPMTDGTPTGGDKSKEETLDFHMIDEDSATTDLLASESLNDTSQVEENEDIGDLEPESRDNGIGLASSRAYDLEQPEGSGTDDEECSVPNGYFWNLRRPGARAEESCAVSMKDGPIVMYFFHTLEKTQLLAELNVLEGWVSSLNLASNVDFIFVRSPHHKSLDENEPAHITAETFSRSASNEPDGKVYHIFSENEDPAQGYSHYNCRLGRSIWKRGLEPLLAGQSALSHYRGEYSNNTLDSDQKGSGRLDVWMQRLQYTLFQKIQDRIGRHRTAVVELSSCVRSLSRQVVKLSQAQANSGSTYNKAITKVEQKLASLQKEIKEKSKLELKVQQLTERLDNLERTQAKSSDVVAVGSGQDKLSQEDTPPPWQALKSGVERTSLAVDSLDRRMEEQMQKLYDRWNAQLGFIDFILRAVDPEGVASRHKRRTFKALGEIYRTLAKDQLQEAEADDDESFPKHRQKNNSGARNGAANGESPRQDSDKQLGEDREALKDRDAESVQLLSVTNETSSSREVSTGESMPESPNQASDHMSDYLTSLYTPNSSSTTTFSLSTTPRSPLSRMARQLNMSP
ncbi:MAG: hypothetical protein M1820_009590 [Bogoriella megaspora]|nr:MAG: hypothetical protein M1820_009590 [Bogoriella megaspora]